MNSYAPVERIADWMAPQRALQLGTEFCDAHTACQGA